MSSSIDRPVTKFDVASVLKRMRAALPKRIALDAELEFEAFEIALKGVLARDLAEAVDAIIQGALRHAFYPSPPELRMQCDAVCDARLAVLAEERRRRAIRDEAAAFGPVKHDPAEAERVEQIYRKFCEWDDRERRGVVPVDEEIEAIRAKYSPIALAQIPDRRSYEVGKGR